MGGTYFPLATKLVTWAVLVHTKEVCRRLPHVFRKSGVKIREQIVTWCLVVVDVYPLQLQVTVTLVTTGGIDAMLIAYDLPELRRDKKKKKKRFVQTYSNVFKTSWCLKSLQAFAELLCICLVTKWYAAVWARITAADWTAPCASTNNLNFFFFLFFYIIISNLSQYETFIAQNCKNNKVWHGAFS